MTSEKEKINSQQLIRQKSEKIIKIDLKSNVIEELDEAKQTISKYK